jgi:hypothetical protein
VEAFSAARRPEPARPTDVLVLSADGKGVVMRPEALRAATARAARSRKLSTRLSKGEKRDRKRMAKVVAVYDLTPSPRTAGDIITHKHRWQQRNGHRHTRIPTATATAPGPRARGKWLTASLTRTTAQVIAAAFDEAERRDPAHAPGWRWSTATPTRSSASTPKPTAAACA